MLTSVESQLSPISEFSLIVERMMLMGGIETDGAASGSSPNLKNAKGKSCEGIF